MKNRENSEVSSLSQSGDLVNLSLLERAWEEAEEIAEISDNLFLPEGTDEFLEEHRGTGAPGRSAE